MTNNIKISDVLHLAADKYLASCESERGVKCRFSCSAISEALDELIPDWYSLNMMYRQIDIGLREMGLDLDANGFPEFEYERSFVGWKSVSVTESSQGARYAWLKFAAMIAEEQGV